MVTLAPLVTEGADRTSLEDEILKLQAILGKQTSIKNIKPDGKAADKYCICVNCDLITTEIPTALMKVAALVRAQQASTATEAILPLKEFLSEQAAEGQC